MPIRIGGPPVEAEEDVELEEVEEATDDEVAELTLPDTVTVFVETDVVTTVVVFVPTRLEAPTYIMPKPIRNATTIDTT